MSGVPTPTPAATTPAATPPANTPAADGAGPWHSGIEADTLGFWQNKGWTPDNPKDLAINMTKSYRELEKHFGVPADQLLKMPKADAKPEDIKAFWQRLGAPDKPTDYDFSSVKLNGEPLDQAFVDSMREAMAQNFIPKERATQIAEAFAKYVERDFQARQTLNAAKLAEEAETLRKNWGTQYDYNHLKAMDGARRLGISKEAVTAMEKEIGYAGVMEAMRKIGAGTSEAQWVDTGVSPNGGPGNIPMTREGAQQRLNERMNDKAWASRLTSGDMDAHREWMGLITMIDGRE